MELAQRMNMKFGESARHDAHVMKNVNLDINAYETLCLICAELSVNLDDVSDSSFEAASDVLDDFCKAANDDTGYTVSVWFD